MRIISLVLCLCLSLNLFAASPVAEFENALDNYEYSMTTEWDQVDPVFSEETTKAFFEAMNELTEKGLTQEDMMNVLSKKALGKREIEAIKLKLQTSASEAGSPQELAKVIAAHSRNLYRSGASWDGSVIIMGGVGVVVVALIGYSIWYSATHTCVAYAQGQQCGWTSYYYGGPQYYQCWPTTYCTQYVKN
jgi:hypothetical protein